MSSTDENEQIDAQSSTFAIDAFDESADEYLMNDIGVALRLQALAGERSDA